MRKQFARAGASTFIHVTLMSQPWLKKKINALELYTIDVILGRRADTDADGDAGLPPGQFAKLLASSSRNG